MKEIGKVLKFKNCVELQNFFGDYSTDVVCYFQDKRTLKFYRINEVLITTNDEKEYICEIRYDNRRRYFRCNADSSVTIVIM